MLDSEKFHILSVAMIAALEAGQYFSRHVNQTKTVKEKSSPLDLVTEVDPQCESLIRARIAKDFPHHDVLGEESTAPGAAASVRTTTSAAAAEHLWIIDPLDGTTNFVHEICLSVVSIAYAHQGHVRMGVVYNPYQDEMFCAYHAWGAFRIRGCDAADWIGQVQYRVPLSAPAAVVSTAEALAGKGTGSTERTDPGPLLGVKIPSSWIPLRVSTQQSLSRALVASDFPARGLGASERTEAGLNLAASAGSFRSIGAAALQLAWVAAGRLDAYWGYDLNAWDIAAGTLLVQEAGGVIGAIDGGSYDLLSRDILATGQQKLATMITRSLHL